jgi:maltose O-acetyltransferase
MAESRKTMRERMLAGQLYIADDPDLTRESARAQRLTFQINTMDPTDHERRHALLAELFGAFGDGSDIRPPLQCDYGGGVIVCPGVTIGADTVVGAGSVVARDLPPGVVAVGSPARVLRAL